MKQGRRFGFSAEQKLDVWRRWKAGQTLHEIGRAFGKEHSSIRCLVSRHGGIAPASNGVRVMFEAQSAVPMSKPGIGGNVGETMRSLSYGVSRGGSASNFVFANPSRSRASSSFSRITTRSRLRSPLTFLRSFSVVMRWHRFFTSSRSCNATSRVGRQNYACWFGQAISGKPRSTPQGIPYKRSGPDFILDALATVRPASLRID
jgi:hypothetical protein